eukprot:m.858131 g.858131  ORF g.858131 m.858131 type:complete len:56 (-) comp59653_c0_seq3:92-259(-)
MRHPKALHQALSSQTPRALAFLDLHKPAPSCDFGVLPSFLLLILMLSVLICLCLE